MKSKGAIIRKLFFCGCLKNIRSYYYLRRKIHSSDSNLRIVIGSGGISDDGWLPTDIETLDILKDTDWQRLFKNYPIKAILAEHVWEHLGENEGVAAAENCYKYLQKNGYLRIAVPDGYHPDPEYINNVKAGGVGSGAKDHKILYTYKTLKNLLEIAGFSVELLEYFDEYGDFHFNDWDPADGKIRRSKRFDRRNSDGHLGYTSIIIDAKKSK